MGLDLPRQREADLRHALERRQDGSLALGLTAGTFLQSVRIACEGFEPDDNYFHLAPGEEKRLVLRALSPDAEFRGWLEALNLAEPVALRADGPGRAANDPALGRPA
jgi:hypothetical protein